MPYIQDKIRLSLIIRVIKVRPSLNNINIYY
jgi:hypothetical protein